MENIGIVGAGIGGLHLGLFLLQHGIRVTIYSDSLPGHIRAGRVPNFVIRFNQTRERERSLRVEHWDSPEADIPGVHMHIGFEPEPIVWKAAQKRPASGVDMRIYQSTLLEDFAERGGEVVFGALEAADVARLSDRHELMVVASGRGSLTRMFQRDPSRSPFDSPQRLLAGAYYRGLEIPDPVGVIYSVSPGNGEIFQAPYATFGGRACAILFEGIPGGAFDAVTRLRYEDDPKKYEATVLKLVREHAPSTYEQIDPRHFGVLHPLDVLQGAITPTVRRGYVPLGNGKYALALGDVHMTFDPILGQGANTASRCALVLGHILLADQPADENFCREAERKLWESGRAAVEWTNMMLRKLPAYAVDLFAAAAQNKAAAAELADNFDLPERGWDLFKDPANAALFLKKHEKREVVDEAELVFNY